MGLPKLSIRLAEIAVVAPLFAIGYFILSTNIARNVEVEAWIAFFVTSVLRLFRLRAPTSVVTRMPAVPVLFEKWMDGARAWIDVGLAVLLLLDIALSITLSRELRLHGFASSYVLYETAVRVLSLSVAGIYFSYEWIAGLPGQFSVTNESPVRRAVLGSLAVLSFVALTGPVGRSLAQLATHRRFPNPRYRKARPPGRLTVNLPHGFYRNPKSGRIFYVNASRKISCYGPIKVSRLVRLPQITEADFPNLSQVTVKTCFEQQALSALQQGKIRDAEPWLELGTRYEIYSKAKYPHHRINYRIVKLFAGICYRYKIKGRIPVIKQKLLETGLVDAFQPEPQKWLGKASDFKYRWSWRKTYDGVPLTQA